LPNILDATEEQKATGMCWESEDELYNNGTPFKITLRDKRGIMVTILADNYFGYCKKEVKTQIGLSANIFGSAEEVCISSLPCFVFDDMCSHFVYTFSHHSQLIGACRR